MDRDAAALVLHQQGKSYREISRALGWKSSRTSFTAVRRASTGAALLTCQQAAQILGVKYEAIGRYAAAGLLEKRHLPAIGACVTATSAARLKAILGARHAVNAAQWQMAVIAATGKDAELREATVALAQAKADLMIAETGVT